MIPQLNNMVNLKKKLEDLLKSRNPDILDIAVLRSEIEKESPEWYLGDCLKQAEIKHEELKMWLERAINCVIDEKE